MKKTYKTKTKSTIENLEFLLNEGRKLHHKLWPKYKHRTKDVGYFDEYIKEQAGREKYYHWANQVLSVLKRSKDGLVLYNHALLSEQEDGLVKTPAREFYYDLKFLSELLLRFKTQTIDSVYLERPRIPFYSDIEHKLYFQGLEIIFNAPTRRKFRNIELCKLVFGSRREMKKGIPIQDIIEYWGSHDDKKRVYNVVAAINKRINQKTEVKDLLYIEDGRVKVNDLCL